MTIDDIYFAAINGDKELLVSLLAADEVDLNQRIDGGVTNGLHTSFTVLFSVLAQMRQTGFNYEILDTLVYYGIDLNASVLLKCDAFTRGIPYLAYAIREWDTPELVQYFMERGANPNVTQEETYADGHRESYPLAYLALQFRQDSQVLNMLLHYGADPNKQIVTYNHDAACRQSLTMTFYALVNHQSLEKCAALFSYGADLKDELIVGIGLIPCPKFKQYITLAYPQYLDLLNAAYRQGSRNPRRPIHISRDDFLIRRNHYHAPKASEAPQKEQVSDPLQELRTCAEQLIAYEWKWKERYAEAVRLSKLPPKGFNGKKQQKNAEDAAALVVNARNDARELLNDLDKKLTGGKTPRWWNTFNGLVDTHYPNKEVLVWIPFDRLTEAPDGLSLTAICTENDSISEQEVQLLMKAGTVSPIYVGKPDPAGQYRMAELCFWSILDATEVHRTVTNTHSDREIRDALRSRSEAMDEHERFLNTLQSKGSFTNEELHLGGQMQSRDFFNSQLLREQALRNYQEKLSNAKTTQIRVENQKLFRQYYRPVGLILFDQAHHISFVLIYNQPKNKEVYLMDFNKTIYGIEVKECDISPAANRLLGIRNLKNFDIVTPDILGQKPDYLSEDEWLEMIYHCYCIRGSAGLEESISAAYQRAAAQKQDTIHSSYWL